MDKIDDTLARAIAVKNIEKLYGVAAICLPTGGKNVCVKRNNDSKLA